MIDWIQDVIDPVVRYLADCMAYVNQQAIIEFLQVFCLQFMQFLIIKILNIDWIQDVIDPVVRYLADCRANVNQRDIIDI